MWVLMLTGVCRLWITGCVVLLCIGGEGIMGEMLGAVSSSGDTNSRRVRGCVVLPYTGSTYGVIVHTWVVGSQ